MTALMKRVMPFLVVVTALTGWHALAAGADGRAAHGFDAFVEAEPLSNLPSSAQGNATATCPSGSRVVGGGINTSDGPNPTKPTYTLQLAGPQDETGLSGSTVDGDVATHFQAAIRNTGSATYDFKVLALCSRTSNAVIKTNEATGVATDTDFDAHLTCPGGTRVVGGGVNSSTGPNPTGNGSSIYSISQNGPVGNNGIIPQDGGTATGWAARIRNLTGKTQTFKLFALCSAESDATVVSVTLSEAAGKSDFATAVCPSGRHITSGGVITSTAADSYRNKLQLSGPQDETGLTANTNDGDVARQWQAAFTNNTSTTQEFTVVALCESDVAPVSGATPTTTPTGGTSPTATPTVDPGVTPTVTPVVKSKKPRLKLAVAPKKVRAGVRTVFSIAVSVKGDPVRHARVAGHGHHARTSAAGRASLTLRFKHPGAYSVQATKRGYRVGAATITVKPQR